MTENVAGGKVESRGHALAEQCCWPLPGEFLSQGRPSKHANGMFHNYNDFAPATCLLRSLFFSTFIFPEHTQTGVLFGSRAQPLGGMLGHRARGGRVGGGCGAHRKRSPR